MVESGATSHRSQLDLLSLTPHQHYHESKHSILAKSCQGIWPIPGPAPRPDARKADLRRGWSRRPSASGALRWLQWPAALLWLVPPTHPVPGLEWTLVWPVLRF